MKLQERVDAFIQLGKFIQQFEISRAGIHFSENPALKTLNSSYKKKFEVLIQRVPLANPWFIPEFLQTAFTCIQKYLTPKALNNWVEKYPALKKQRTAKRIGVVMAGNIPMVGFHDMLSVLISGHLFVGKLSAKDDKLLPFFGTILKTIHPGFNDFLFFETGLIKNMDAYIATGSNNTSRYFYQYFGKYPHIIRKNRNSVAILTGNEKKSDLNGLASDIMLYFGLGCRNVSKIFVPENYNFTPLIKSLNNYNFVIENQKYANNYDYQKSIFLVNKIKFIDTGYVLLRENPDISSPVSVINYENYKCIEILNDYLKDKNKNLQCIVSKSPEIKNKIPFGKGQHPDLSDYADNIDTLHFLINL